MDYLLIFKTAEEGVANLKMALDIRSKMIGAMHWNMANETAINILNRLSDEYFDQVNIDELEALFEGIGIQNNRGAK